jgi:hypothetical protein
VDNKTQKTSNQPSFIVQNSEQLVYDFGGFAGEQGSNGEQDLIRQLIKRANDYET